MLPPPSIPDDDCNCGAEGFACPPGTTCIDGVCTPIGEVLEGSFTVLTP